MKTNDNRLRITDCGLRTRAPRLFPFSVFRLPSSVLLASALLVGCGRAPEPTEAVPDNSAPIRAVLSTNAIRIGDPATLRVTVTLPTNESATLPSVEQGKAVLVRDATESRQSLPDGRARTVYDLKLTSFEVGSHVLASGKVVAVTSGTNTYAEPFPYVALEVVSSLSTPDEQPRDLKGLATWPGRFPRWTWVLPVIALVALVAGLLARHFLNKPRTILNMPPPEPPDARALRALHRLRDKGFIEAHKVEPFYVELSKIVRAYLEDRFALRAPERTTEEFIREAVSSRVLAPEHQRLTAAFLEQADLVKFARHEPETGDMRNAYGAAERLVVETRPQPAPATPGEAGS